MIDLYFCPTPNCQEVAHRSFRLHFSAGAITSIPSSTGRNEPYGLQTRMARFDGPQCGKLRARRRPSGERRMNLASKVAYVVLALAATVLIAGLAGCGPDKPAAAGPVSASPPAAATSAPPCTYCTETSPRDCAGLCLVNNPLLIASREGVAKGSIRVCNNGSEPKRFALDLAAFRASVPGGTYTFGSTAALGPVDANDRSRITSDGKLQPGCLRLLVNATGLLQAGVMSAQLLNDGKQFGELKAVRPQVAFDLKVDGQNPSEVNVTIVRDTKARITLRNADPIPYRFTWRLELGGEPLLGTAEVGPEQLVNIPFDGYRAGAKGCRSDDTGQGADACGFWQNGFLGTGKHDGRLVLRHLPDPSFDERPTIEKAIKVHAQFSYFTSDRQRFANGAFIFIIVLLGILTSLGINYALPMMRKRYAIKQRLAEQDGGLGGIGSVVASRTLNLLRVEKRRLRQELHSLWVVDPETEAALPKLEGRVVQLGRRIELAARAGELLKAVKGDTRLAQHEIGEAALHCRLVLTLAELPNPTEVEFGRMQTELDAAAAVRALRDQAPDAVRVNALKARAREALKSPQFEGGAPPEWTPFAAYLAGLRRLFLQEPDEKSPDRERYVDAADAVTRAEAILRYAQLIDTAGDPELRNGRLARADELLAALRPGRDASAPDASDLLDEIEQNVNAAAIAAALRKAKPGDLHIEVDPPTPWPYQLVVFRVHLAARGYDEASAREKIDWTWTVSGQAEPLPGNDWMTCHFFEPGATGETTTVTACAIDPADPPNPLATAPVRPFRLEKAKTYTQQLTLLSVFSLAITVLVVGVGLIATAQDKLQSIDWLAGIGVVFGVGFAADVLRRLLGRSDPTQPTS